MHSTLFLRHSHILINQLESTCLERTLNGIPIITSFFSAGLGISVTWHDAPEQRKTMLTLLASALLLALFSSGFHLCVNSRSKKKMLNKVFDLRECLADRAYQELHKKLNTGSTHDILPAIIGIAIAFLGLASIAWGCDFF